jgi:hypothetical protein
MLIDYVQDPLRGWLFTTASGLVTFDDINEHLNLEEHNRDLSRLELIDARSAPTNLTADQIRRLAQRAADAVARVPTGPTAIVRPSTTPPATSTPAPRLAHCEEH